MQELEFIKMYEDVTLPAYETPGSSGMDVRAYFPGGCGETIYSNDILVVPTGLLVNIPEGYELQVRPRSGLAFNKMVTVLNAPGTIDSDFKYEIKVCLINHSSLPIPIEHNDRIAQLVYAKVERPSEVEVKSTERSGGFGSTGV